MPLNTFKLIQTLTEASGPSGGEGPAAAILSDLWRPLVDEIQVDRVGSVVGRRHGSGPANGRRHRVLLAAHIDEIGLMVSDIAEWNGYGFLRVDRVGGIDRRQLLGQRVTVHAGDGRSLTGVIGTLPDTFLPPDRKNKALAFETLLVDVGLPIETVRTAVSIGDFITFQQPLRRLLNKRVFGKALDNRASVAAVTLALEHLSTRDHAWDVVVVATAQEETRLLGAYTSGHVEQPDVAIAIDVTFGKGPGATEPPVFELDVGPPLGIGVNVHPAVYRRLHETAEALELKTEPDPHGRASGTDAYGLQVARGGIPTGLVGIPIRYMHTVVETAALRDIERAGRLLGEFCATLDDNFLTTLSEGHL